MEKKKAVICTILFAIVIVVIAICSLMIRSEDGSLSLFTLLSYTITGGWLSDCVHKFYKWLMD